MLCHVDLCAHTMICMRSCTSIWCCIQICCVQGTPFESELEYLAYGCQGDPLVQTAVLSFQQQTALRVSPPFSHTQAVENYTDHSNNQEQHQQRQQRTVTGILQALVTTVAMGVTLTVIVTAMMTMVYVSHMPVLMTGWCCMHLATWPSWQRSPALLLQC